jgi:beta-lactamase class A
LAGAAIAGVSAGQADAVHAFAPQSQTYSAPAARSPVFHAAQRALDDRIDSLGRGFVGDVGIAVKDLQTGYTAAYDGASHFPQQSVSKFWVTLTALDKADRGELNLDAPVTVRKSDLTLFNQPIAQQIGPNGYTTTLTELMRRAMQQSDNTCNDFVLWRAGGPEAVRSFLERKGISGIRFGPGERVMQSRIAGMEWNSSMTGSGFYAARNRVPASVRRASFEKYVSDPVDGATPLGIVDALAKLKRGELLSRASTDKLLRIMSNTKTGPQRLKGGLAPGWSLAHKTGTGQVLGPVQSGYNDIGIVTSPDGRSYAVAVMIRKTSTPIPQRMALMQNVTRAVIDYNHNLQTYSIARGTDYRRAVAEASN